MAPDSNNAKKDQYLIPCYSVFLNLGHIHLSINNLTEPNRKAFPEQINGGARALTPIQSLYCREK